MNGFARVKQCFFDTRPIMDAVLSAQYRVHRRFGAFVRNAARWSIRKRKGPSIPGQPPHSHTGLLKDFIFFVVEGDANVVIGPTLLSGVTFGPSVDVRTTVPEILEEGGTGGVIEDAFREDPPGAPRGSGKLVWRRRDLRRRGRAGILERFREQARRGFVYRKPDGTAVIGVGTQRFRSYRIAARPYMQPAFDKGLEKLDDFWADSVRPPTAARAA